MPTLAEQLGNDAAGPRAGYGVFSKGFWDKSRRDQDALDLLDKREAIAHKYRSQEMSQQSTQQQELQRLIGKINLDKIDPETAARIRELQAHYAAIDEVNRNSDERSGGPEKLKSLRREDAIKTTTFPNEVKTAENTTAADALMSGMKLDRTPSLGAAQLNAQQAQLEATKEGSLFDAGNPGIKYQTDLAHALINQQGMKDAATIAAGSRRDVADTAATAKMGGLSSALLPQNVKTPTGLSRAALQAEADKQAAKGGDSQVLKSDPEHAAFVKSLMNRLGLGLGNAPVGTAQ